MVQDQPSHVALASVEQLYKQVADLIEVEVAVATDTKVSHADWGFRGLGPAMVWRPLLRKPGGDRQRSQHQAYGWVHMAATSLMAAVKDMGRRQQDVVDTIQHWLRVFDSDMPPEVTEHADLVATIEGLKKDVQLIIDDVAGQVPGAWQQSAARFSTSWQDDVEELAAGASSEADAGRLASAISWHHWCTTALSEGAGPAHRYSRAAEEWAPTTAIAAEGRVVADPLELLAKEARILHEACVCGGPWSLKASCSGRPMNPDSWDQPSRLNR